MTIININYERRKAVANAWKNEKSFVKDGKGTRDWNQKEQREIISKGKVKGYQGHHMKSVDGHITRAGDANNIQFLTRSEHLAAHNGNFRNNTNGYYEPKTGKIHNFGRNMASIEMKCLSKPLSDSQKRAALSKVGLNKKVKVAKNKAKSVESRNVIKTKSSSESRIISSNKSFLSSKNAFNDKSISMKRSISCSECNVPIKEKAVTTSQSFKQSLASSKKSSSSSSGGGKSKGSPKGQLR